MIYKYAKNQNRNINTIWVFSLQDVMFIKTRGRSQYTNKTICTQIEKKLPQPGNMLLAIQVPSKKRAFLQHLNTKIGATWSEHTAQYNPSKTVPMKNASLAPHWKGSTNTSNSLNISKIGGLMTIKTPYYKPGTESPDWHQLQCAPKSQHWFYSIPLTRIRGCSVDLTGSAC